MLQDKESGEVNSGLYQQGRKEKQIPRLFSQWVIEIGFEFITTPSWDMCARRVK